MALRQDIQALRGWAVTLVVLDHADIGPFHHGYLGVDIFFVISGYLITRILADQISDGSFSFTDFYFKRARRILPAAYATLILTCIGSVWFLTSIEIDALRNQVFGVLTFTSNFVFHSQTDYFATTANTKPLLHTWSLAIEEQYYLLAPATMFFMPIRYWRPATLALFALCLLACLILVRFEPSSAFYMLPTRAWELMIGAIGALYFQRLQNFDAAWRILFWPALAALAIIPAISFGLPHPGIQSLAVCLATLVIILAQKEGLFQNFGARIFSRIGDISYSLYLVHWPILVFTFAAYLSDAPLEARLVAVGMSLLLAIGMYVYVERPARYHLRIPTPQIAAATIAFSVGAVGLYFGTAAYARLETDFTDLRRPNVGLSRGCDISDAQYKASLKCQTAPEPKVLVWGDSYAMHLVPGLMHSTEKGIVQATVSSCGPFLNYAIAPKRIKSSTEDGAKRCISFNKRVLEHLKDWKSIETVILGSPIRYAVNEGSEMFMLSGQKLIRRESGMDLAMDGMGRIIEQVQRMGKKVIVVAPPPAAGWDTSICVERAMTGKIILGDVSSCNFDADHALKRDVRVNKFLDALSARYGVTVVRIADAICSNGMCETMIDGAPIYRDQGHLSYKGSIWAIPRTTLGDHL